MLIFISIIVMITFCSSVSAGDEIIKPFSFVRIESGIYHMGGKWIEKDEKPVHKINISKSFEISDHEVTVGEYRKFVESTGYEPPTKSGSDESSGYDKQCNWNRKNMEDHPVNCVSWKDAQSYISWLNMLEGKTIYRLPTEAEWEYAARAGTQTPWACGENVNCLKEIGWFAHNSDGRTHPVKTKKANPWKIYDMHGNVFEWVQDRYDTEYYKKSPEKDPLNSSDGSWRVRRGGSFYDSPEECRSAARSADAPDYCYISYGFRLVRSLDQ